MIVDFAGRSERLEADADVCIVGAGPAGITLAVELADAGKSVLLLEGGGLDYSERSQDLYDMIRADDIYPDPLDSRVRFLGGSTNHWEGSCRLFDPIDFERRSWVPDSGWPYSYEDLVPFYERAFSYLELYRPFAVDRAVRNRLGPVGEALRRDGFTARVNHHSPPVRFGEAFRDRLRDDPRIRLIVNANLTSLQEADDAQSILGAHFVNYGSGSGFARANTFVLALGGLENPRALLLSDQVSPRGIGNERGLVGRSFMDHPTVEAVALFPSRLFSKAWRGGKVVAGGQTLNLSIEATEEHLRKRELTNARMPPHRAPLIYTSEGIESANQLARAVRERDVPAHLLTHLWNIVSEADVIFELWRRRTGRASWIERADDYGGMPMQMMIEQYPDPHNRVELSDERDALGLRRGVIHYRLGEAEEENTRRLVEDAARAFGAHGLGFMRSFLRTDDTGRRFDDQLNFGHHHMGTTRSSDNPRKGVVDGHQRVHGRRNLYIAGSSVFPTGSHIPPTTTIVATTVRLADHLKGKAA